MGFEPARFKVVESIKEEYAPIESAFIGSIPGSLGEFNCVSSECKATREGVRSKVKSIPIRRQRLGNTKRRTAPDP